MNLTNYLKAGYGCLFINGTEIKRAVSSITVDPDKYQTIHWNINRGLILNEYKFDEDRKMDQLKILDHVRDFQNTAVILENYDQYLSNMQVIQKIMDMYFLLKTNQSCLIIVGSNPKLIPPVLKELMPTLEFQLPNRIEIQRILKGVAETSLESIKEGLENKAITKKQFDSYDYTITDETIEACKGMSTEEIENVIALAAIEKKCFDTNVIYERKREIIRSTGFMDFMRPKPIDALGGMDLFIDYINRRREPFLNPKSNKPKIKAILIVGVQGCGKSLIMQVACSIFDWPGIMLDLNATKGGLVGQTEAQVRTATKYIDSFGRCIVGVDEIDKIFSGSGKGQKHETSEGMLGHFLTWSQERDSEGLFFATANSLENLPPEFLRTGRWDAIFFVGLPDPIGIKQIIEIKNKQYESKLPTDSKFCNQLYKERWSGAEIEQLAKDSHYNDDLKMTAKQIPILAEHKSEEINELIQAAEHFRRASSIYTTASTKRKISIH